MKILMIENHVLFAQTVKAAFLSDHEVFIAGSLQTGIKALNEHRFDLLLIDYDLDDGKGEEIMEMVKTMPVRCPVIAISAFDEKNERLVSKGADCSCSKLQFAKQIREIIGQFNAS